MKPSSKPSEWTPDSPDLTAFALKDGPFDPAVPGWAERRSEAEQAVVGSPELRAEIGEIRRLADEVEVDLSHEPIHRLSPDRRQTVLAYARNPGRGLPRRSSDDAPASEGSGWHRFWSGLTRPVMGFSLAAATALSIALALWNPWRRPASEAPVPVSVAKAPSSNAPARTKRPVPADDVGAKSSEVESLEVKSPEVMPPGSLASQADAAGPATLRAKGLSPGDPRRDGQPEPTAVAPGSESESPAPRVEVARGESRLRWPSDAARPAAAAGAAGSASARSAPVVGREASPPSTPAANGSAKKASTRNTDAIASAPRNTASPILPPVSAQMPRPTGVAAAKARPNPSSNPSSNPSADPASAGSRAAVSRRQAQTPREIPFQSAAAVPRSSFPLEPADTSYPEVRRELEQGRLPSPDAVRLDELLNHFSYDYPSPSGSDPLSAHVEVADSPWSPDHRLVKIGLQARSVPPAARPPANLVVLVGLRPGSSARLSWAQRSLQALVETLDGRDSMALLLDGPRGGLILPPTPGGDRDRLSRGVAALRAEGAPTGLEGLRRAYAMAAQRRLPGGVDRVIWILDGEFSAEAGTRETLAKLIGDQTERGVLLTVLGLGASAVDPDPSQPPWMPTPAGGAYASAGSPAEAREALRRELHPSPIVAEGVQVDVRFNPARVDRWRLIGHESPESSAPSGGPGEPPGARVESGESVTALYEIVPTRPADPGTTPSGTNASLGNVSGIGASTRGGVPEDLLRLEVGYRAPAPATGSAVPSPGPQARRFEVGVPDAGRGIDAATADYKFAAAVVGYGLLLRDSPFKGDLTWDKVLALAEEGQGPDREGYRAEFLDLVRRARDLSKAAGRGTGQPSGSVTPRP